QASVHLNPIFRNWCGKSGWLQVHSWFHEKDAIHPHYRLASVMIAYSQTRYPHYHQTGFRPLWFLMTPGISLPSILDSGHHPRVPYYFHSDWKDVHFYPKSKNLASDKPVDAHEYSRCRVYCRKTIPNA